MRKINWILLMLLLNTMSVPGQELDIMTYNIRYATPSDGENRWEARKEFLAEQIGYHDPDLFGTQEGLQEQLAFVQDYLEKYSFVGVGRDDGGKKGEYCAIFFKRDRLEVRDEGTFWLSESPDRVSKGWDAALPRIATYALLREKGSGREFWVFNTHFDHIGQKAREQSAKLLVEKIRELNKQSLPVLLMGDLNLNETSEPVKYLASRYLDARNSSEARPFGPLGTFNDFSVCDPVGERIDYIFVSQGIRVKKYAVFSDQSHGRYPSDHFPVFAKVQLPGEKSFPEIQEQE